MKKKKRPDIRVNFVFFAIKSVMVIVFPLISFPYISRVLGVEGLGKFQYCYSVISYFILFASLGISYCLSGVTHILCVGSFYGKRKKHARM